MGFQRAGQDRATFTFNGDSTVKNLADNAGDLGLIPGSGDPLEKETAIHSSIIAWRIQWTEDPGEYHPWSSKELDTTQEQIPSPLLLSITPNTDKSPLTLLPIISSTTMDYSLPST